MGSLNSKIYEPLMAFAQSTAQIIPGRKRKHQEDADTSNGTLAAILNTHKRKKVATSKYIYRVLFEEKQNYDITVIVLGKVWRLHKLYLSKSPYISDMISESGCETDQTTLNIDIVNPKVNQEAVETVFGSLYDDQVTIDAKNVTSILATAIIFQLDGLIERCAHIMTETISDEMVMLYYEAACEYGIPTVQMSTFKWLLMNLYAIQSTLLRQISVALMEQLVSCADLFRYSEYSLYVLLRQWVFLKLHPDENECNETFFANLEDETPFLLTSAGLPYERAFRRLRLLHLLNHPNHLNIIIEDNLMPRSWLNEPLLLQWTNMLMIDQSQDDGPKECDKRRFLESCVRFGYIQQESGMWRWNVFYHGLDLVFITDSGMLSIKRHHRTETGRLLSLQSQRNILVRVTLSSLNDQRQVIHSQRSEIIALCLEMNEETLLMFLDKELEFPLYISVDLLVVSPSNTGSAATSAHVDTQTLPNVSNIGSAGGSNRSGSSSNDSD